MSSFRLFDGDIIDGFGGDTMRENPEWVSAPYEVGFWFAKRHEQRYWTRKRKLKHKRRQERILRLEHIARHAIVDAVANNREARLLMAMASIITPATSIPILFHGDQHI